MWSPFKNYVTEYAMGKSFFEYNSFIYNSHVNMCALSWDSVSWFGEKTLNGSTTEKSKVVLNIFMNAESIPPITRINLQDTFYNAMNVSAIYKLFKPHKHTLNEYGYFLTRLQYTTSLTVACYNRKIIADK